MPSSILAKPNQTVKNGLRRSNCPKWNFFLEKQLIKFSCIYWPYSWCKIFKKILRATPSYDDIPFSGQKCLNKLFLVQPIIITFTYLLAFSPTFSLSKILQQIQIYEDAPFLGPKSFIYPEQTLLWKKLILYLSTHWPLSLCNLLQKFLQRIQGYKDGPFLGPNWLICPNKNFFRKPITKPCSFQIIIIMKYWQLKNTEI